MTTTMTKQWNIELLRKMRSFCNRVTQHTLRSFRNTTKISDKRVVESILSNISQVDEEKLDIVTAYDEICTYLSVEPGDEALDLRKINLLDNASKALYMNSNQILLYLKFIKPHEVWELPEQFFERIVPSVFERPNKLDLKLFGYDAYTGRFIRPKNRYIANSSAHEAMNYLKTKHELNTDPITGYYKEQDVVLGGHSRMFKLLCSQERIGSAETQILSVLFSKQSKNEETLANSQKCEGKPGPCKRGCDLVGIQAIAYLLRDREIFPYTTAARRMHVVDMLKDFSCTLPQVIIILLNISVMELLGVYTHEYSKIVVEYMFDKTPMSICQAYLEEGGILKDLAPALYLDIPHCHTVLREPDGVPSGKTSLNDFKDWDYENKKKIYTEKISNLRGINRKVWRYVSSIVKGNGSERSIRIRYAIMLLNGITSPAIFNKTSLVLEYEKSAAPVQNITVPYPSVKQRMYDIDGNSQAITWNWDELPDLVKGVYRVFKNKYHQRIVEALKTKDFEKEFAEAMTNRSEGIKVEDPDLPKRLQNISNTRVISLALNPDDLNDYVKCLNKLRSGGFCAIRFQIRRRARVVVMVIKQKQAQQIVVLRGFEQLKKMCDVIDVGQQKGDIRNCSSMLHGSSGTYGINNSSDLKGQDAHTMPVMSDFINSLYTDTVFENTAERYYCHETSEKLVSTGNKDPVPTKVSAVFQYCAMVTREGRPTKYILKDECFKQETEFVVSDATYESGLYGTTAQHTTLFSLDHEARVEDFNALIGNKSKLISTGKSVGDDYWELIRGDESDIKRYLDFSRKRLEDVNFEIDANVSKVFSTFLQNDCLFGMYIPKPDRMSLFCEEKHEVRNRERLDVAKILASLGKIFSQRTISNDNLRGLVMSGWNALRHTSYIVSKEDSKLAFILERKKYLTKWIKYNKSVGRLEILLPYITICLPPLSFSLPPLKWGEGDESGVTTGTSMTAPNGDVNWIYLANMFDTNKKFDLESNVIGKDIEKPRRLDQILKRPSKTMNYDMMSEFGVQFGLHMLRFNRDQTLSERREDELTTVYKQSLVNFYKKHQDQSKRYASIMAFQQLRDSNVRVSSKLAYFARPDKKIDDALMAKEQNLNERTFVDRALFSYLSKFRGKLPFSVLEIFDSFSLRIVEDEDSSLPYSDDFRVITSMSTLPSYHEHDDFGKLFMRVGGICGSNQYQNYREYQTIVSTLDGIGGTDIIVRESRNVLSKLKDKAFGISLLMDLFGIPQHLLPSFTRILTDNSRMFFYTSYQSYVENQAFMDIDTTLGQVKDQMSVLSLLYNRSAYRLPQFFDAILTHIRDLINSSVSTLSHSPIKRVIVQFKPYSYGRWAHFTRIDSRFSTRVLSNL